MCHLSWSVGPGGCNHGIWFAIFPHSLQDPDPHHGNLWCLKVPVPRVVVARGQREVPTDLIDLVAEHGNDPVNGQVLCQTPACAAYQQVTSSPPTHHTDTF